MTTVLFHRLLAMSLCLAAAAPALAQDRAFDVGNPDRRLWTVREAGFGFGASPATTYVCSHSLCPRATAVTIEQVAGPARRPDAASLRRLANEELPRQIAPSTTDRTPPRLVTATVKGLPAIRGRFTASGPGGPAPIALAIVYLDGTAVRVQATSSDAAYTRRALDAFLDAMTFRGR
jgi:hypothetical protein